ncbi:MAG: hypothetical protein J6W02_01230 [Bacteroidaceae bacterium]|nr:hypothetical protein [Bacteroidaceae bacterium]
MENEKDEYRMITVRDMVEAVSDRKQFPLGLDTPVISGDFEGNYTHLKHELEHQLEGKIHYLVMAYEMHEDWGEV